LAGCTSLDFSQLPTNTVTSLPQTDEHAVGALVKTVIVLPETIVVQYSDGRAVWWGQRVNDIPGESVLDYSSTSTFRVYALVDGTVRVLGDAPDSVRALPDGLHNVVQVAASDTYVVSRTSDGRVIGWGEATQSDVALYPTDVTDAVDIQTRNGLTLIRHRNGTLSIWGDTQNIYGKLQIESLRDLRDAVLLHNGLEFVTTKGILQRRSFDREKNIVVDFTVPMTVPVRELIRGNCDSFAAETMVRTERGEIVSVAMVPVNLTAHHYEFEAVVNEPVVCADDVLIGFRQDGTVQLGTMMAPSEYYKYNRLPIRFPTSIPGAAEILIGKLSMYGALPVGLVRMNDKSLRQFSHGKETHAFPYEVNQVKSLVYGNSYVGIVSENGDALLWGDPAFRGEFKEIPPWAGDFIDINFDSYCGVGAHPDGSVIVWGHPDVCGNQNTQFPLTDVPPEIYGIRKIVSVTDDGQRATVLRADGNVVSWGGSQGFAIEPGLVDIIDVVSRDDKAMFLHQNKTVSVRWNMQPQFVPQQVYDVRLMAVGERNAVVRGDGVMVVWDERYAEEYPGFTDAIDIEILHKSMYVLKADGTLMHWGSIHEVPPDVGEYHGILKQVEL
jgi:hypothetical protein